MKRYSNEVNVTGAAVPPITLGSPSDEFVDGEFAHWRAKKRKVEPETYSLPSTPPPPQHIPLPICKSVYLQNHCWYLATLLIKADIDPDLIRIWQVKVAKKGSKKPGGKPTPHFIGHEGTTFK